jgi:F-type H+-transporting ATPase subunit a
MPQKLALTHLLNQLLGSPITALFAKLGVHPAAPGAPITDAFTMELVVFFVLIAFFLLVRVTLSVEKPGPAQQIAEMLHEFTGSNGEQIIGHGAEKFQAFVTSIFLFVVLNNVLGLIPGIDTPTASPYIPLGIAVPTFFYYHYFGFKAQGFVGYLKHFAGPIWWVAPLLFPIEIVSHLARIMSLTIRLYANMFASDMVTLVFFSLFPLAIPAIFLGLHFAVSLIQAYVFMLLAMIYLSQAVSHDSADGLS